MGMKSELRDIEPFFGWLPWYNHEVDERSPFHDVEHNLFYYDRSINRIPAHPLWDDMGSESLLLKILFVDYQEGYAIIELFGEWNDLYENDFKILLENCLNCLIDYGVQKFIFICENVFHAYLDADDYYHAAYEELEDGWMTIVRARDCVKEELDQYGISQYFYFNDIIDELPWRKLKPFQLYHLIEGRMQKVLE